MIAGNWKMNTTISEAVALVNVMRGELNKIHNVETVLCPPFVSLAAVGELLKGTALKLGAQNVHFAEKGAYTGEISPLMLAGLCDYVIIGHSERRQYFAEGGELINKKIKAALKANLKPILCVGERLEQNETGQTEAVVSEQLTSALKEVPSPAGLILAYEPVWAIGTGKAATGDQASRTIAFIRHKLAKLYDVKTAEETRILYGGSVTAANIAEFVKFPDIDGGLVGGASLKAAEFIGIVTQTAKIKA